MGLYNLLTHSFIHLLLLALCVYYNPQNFPIKFHSCVVQPGCCALRCITVEAARVVRVWLWNCIWKHAAVILWMSDTQHEIVLPFLLSMASVMILVWHVYGPHGADNPGGHKYIAKRHRKWTRYRASLGIWLLKQIVSSEAF